MESIGQTLKSARERKRASLSYVAAQTRIKLQYLELMERDEFARMPAPAYAKGFLRMYADFLGLNAPLLVQQYLDVHVGQRTPRMSSTFSVPERPAAPVTTRTPRREPAPSAAPRVEPQPAPALIAAEPEPAAPPNPRAPRKPWLVFKRQDFNRLKKALADWPWRLIVSVVAVVVAVVMLANGLARWVRRAESAPAASPSMTLKKGVPAVLQEVPEPYLSLPAETTENTR